MGAIIDSGSESFYDLPQKVKKRVLDLGLLEAKMGPSGSEELVQWVKQLPSKSDNLSLENKKAHKG